MNHPYYSGINHGNGKESFITSSLWIFKPRYIKTNSSKTLVILLLLSSGTVERNPGPVKYIDIQELLNLKGINILHQNIRGLSTNFENLQCFIDRNSKIDILTISETHLKKSENDNIEAIYNIYGYDFIFKSREKGIGGGVGIYISNKFDWVRRIDLEKNG